MARKTEAGIQYFALNSDIIHHPKIRLVVAKYGSAKTWGVLLPLLCKIYREKGYYLDYSDKDSMLLFAEDECKTNTETVDEIVTALVARKFFDVRLFTKEGILTSDRIQENYLSAKKRNKDVIIKKEYLILNVNADINDENVDTIVEKPTLMRQNKIKQNKIKQNRIDASEKDAENVPVKDDEIDRVNFTVEEERAFVLFSLWIDKNAARVNKMKERISIEQYLKLKAKFSGKTIQSVLIAMQNRNDLLKKYVSAYLTINNWATREQLSSPDIASKDAINKSQQLSDQKTKSIIDAD